MNDVEKRITQAQLKAEERALKEMKKMFEQAKKDCKDKISSLNAREDMQNVQSIIYQKKYQEIILKQIDDVLKDLNENQYKNLQEFFEGSYYNGYIGSMYDLMNQGIPLIVPINPDKVTNAIKTDSKLSKKYYQSGLFPENISTLKRNVRQQITRGIANGSTWVEVAYQVADKMNSPFDRAMRDAVRIIRTEGHRINQQGFLDASYEAKKKGADIVKQWDATLDGNTRPEHRIADGQIKEIDDYFIVGGEKLKAPSIGGSARNVCNCRCQLLQRAKWALDEDELQTLKDRASFFGLDKTNDFDNFKQKYLKVHDDKSIITIRNKFKTISSDMKSLELKIKELESKCKKYELDVLLTNSTDSFEKAKQLKSEITKYNSDLLNMKLELRNLIKGFKFDFNNAIINLKKYSDFDKNDLIELEKKASNISSLNKKIIWNHSTGYIQTSNSFSINSYLRTGNIKKLRDVEKSLHTIKVLENVINNNHCSKDGILYRYVDADFLEHFNLITDFDVLYISDVSKKEELVDEFNLMCSNEIDNFKSFTSTSYNNDKNVFTNRCVKLTIHTPNGSNMYMTDNDVESEVILNKDSKFKIYGATLENTVFNIYLELLK